MKSFSDIKLKENERTLEKENEIAEKNHDGQESLW